MSNIRIVPAILTEDPASLQAMVRQTATFTNYAQIDIMDGRFVPSRSISAGQITGVPAGLGWEAHLMVREPETYLEDFRKAGARRIIFHYEATAAPEEVIARIKKLGMEAGLAVNPETPVAAFAPLAARLDGVLFLSVNPGFYGSRFIPEVLEKIADFRRAQPDIEIGIDGGIKAENIASAAGSGVDVICVGSAIYLQKDPGESYRRLAALAGPGAAR